MIDLSHLDRFTTPTPVLDHGSITLLDVMGSDDAILQAARTSTSAGASNHKWVDEGDALRCTVCALEIVNEPGAVDTYTHCIEGDRRLIRYLYRQRHATPFESCRIKLHVALPIFVERQWVRHRTAGLNEVSARYTQLPETFYVPSYKRAGMAQSKSNKQGSEASSNVDPVRVRQIIEDACRYEYAQYERLLKLGAPKEIARGVLGVFFYTEKVWWCDLRNLLGFLSLRLDPHAQYEIRMYSQVIYDIVKAWVPFTASAFEDYTLNSHTFSGPEMAVLHELLNGPGPVSEAGMPTKAGWQDLFDRHGAGTKRERGAFLRSLGLIE